MDKKLVAYFSATGITKEVAERLAKAAEADLFEIKPKKAYTSADLNWNDKRSRSSVEMNNKSSRPAVSSKVSDMYQYDTVFVGFPIWWYTAPMIIKTFLESYDFAGKNIVLFATSGSSQMGNTQSDLEPCVHKSAKWIAAKRFPVNVTEAEFKKWVNDLGL